MKTCPVCQQTYPDDYQTCPRDQAVLQADTGELKPGAVLRGKYEVLAELGSGGMATVYKVRHLAFQDLAAVKVVKPELLRDTGFLKRFRNEAIVARQLKHPNAVRIDDFDYTENGRPFIVMEYVEGKSLQELRLASPEPWPVERCLRITAQAAEALSAAHTLGIVHRDIKPANILLVRTASGEVQVKILDFGIAKVAEGSIAGMTSAQTQTGMIIGTPEYMSPEQATGLVETALDGRADLYSLGLVLYEMLTGAHPFHANTPMGMLLQQMSTQPPPPSRVDGVSPSVSALVLKALKKDPAERFRSAAEMLEALKDPEGWYRKESGATEPATELMEPPVVSVRTPVAEPMPLPVAAPELGTVPFPVTAPGPVAEVAAPTEIPQHWQPVPPVVATPVAKPRKQWGLIAAIACILVLLIAGAGWYFYQSAGPQNAGDALKQGDAYFNSGDYPNALKAYRVGANLGNAKAERALGWMYSNGRGVERDPWQATAWFRKAAEQGNVAAEDDMGQAYQNGWGVNQDNAQALLWYQKAASQGNADAQAAVQVLQGKMR